MNNEIKEILDKYLNSLISYPFQRKDKEYILDCITNLQDQVNALVNVKDKLLEENEYLKMNNPEQNMKHFKIINENKRKINNLREQNIDLKQENERLKIKLLQEQNIANYKSRIEKAIEYVKNEMPYLEMPDDFYEDNHKMVEYDKNDLLNILQGGKDDNN